MKLPKHYEPKQAEKKWQEYWEKQGIYRFDPDSKKELFSCDTPPPTVSGKMHIGHALAYSQADYIMRFQRMLNKNIFYPFGFDDNGLATERFVEEKCNIRARDMPRPEFIKLCLKETREAEKELKKDWTSLGISPDWSINYRTIITGQLTIGVLRHHKGLLLIYIIKTVSTEKKLQQSGAQSARQQLPRLSLRTRSKPVFLIIFYLALKILIKNWKLQQQGLN